MSLSDRIRPNSEAAPWVVNEVRDLEKLKNALEAENDKLKQSLSFYMSELAEAQKRVDELGERLYHITGSEAWYYIKYREKYKQSLKMNVVVE